jgi:hypothetical protein
MSIDPGGEMGRSWPRRTPEVGVVIAVLLLAGSGSPVLAQESEPPEWAFESEVGASVLFGASNQTTVAIRVAADRRAAGFELENDLSFLYGEAKAEDGRSFVNKRSWEIGSNLNYRGYSWVNPYVFGSVLASLEKKIDRRYKGGAGAKLTALNSEVSRLDLAAAILAEKTEESSEVNGDEEVLARWSGELRYRRSFSEERMVFSAETEYNPVFNEFDNYTLFAESSIAFKLSEIVSLKLSVVDNYDSRAKNRGARDNNDGRILFSVLSSF